MNLTGTEHLREKILDRFHKTDSGGMGGRELTQREKILLNIALDVTKPDEQKTKEELEKNYQRDQSYYLLLDFLLELRDTDKLTARQLVLCNLLAEGAESRHKPSAFGGHPIVWKTFSGERPEAKRVCWLRLADGSAVLAIFQEKDGLTGWFRLHFQREKGFFISNNGVIAKDSLWAYCELF